MTKMIALLAAGLFAAGSVFAHGTCTKQAANESTMMACHVSMANLNLTADQKTKMKSVMAEHEKAGCSKASEEKFMQEAKGILNKDQYAKFKMEAEKGEKVKA